jgi:prepilin-type N-terminal cleavage/methylation domain-containing protein
MLTNLRKKHNFLPKNSITGFTPTPIGIYPKSKHQLAWGFSLLEMLIVLAIMGIMFGVIVAMKSPFQERMQLRNSALALQEDLRMAQLYAMGKKDDYKYYGVWFNASLGEDILGPGNNRQGWKIVRYEPNTIIPPVNFNSVTYIKSSVLVDNPVIFDKTFFERGVNLSTTSPVSEFQAGSPTPPQLHSIVFNERGSATDNGQNLLTTNNDTIVLSGYGRTININITPLTGHIEVR